MQYRNPLRHGQRESSNRGIATGYLRYQSPECGRCVDQVDPGLPLRGLLKREAPKGKSGVIVNGRELDALDVAALERCLKVVPGGHLILANGLEGRKEVLRRSIWRSYG